MGIEMRRFDEMILQLCKTRKCCLLSHKGNVIEIKSDSTTFFYNDLAYFKAVCDCYMATMYGSTAWIVSVDIEEHIIELGYNY